MANQERILEVENVTDEPIVERWDSVSYRFEPHQVTKLAYGLGVTFVERNPGLVRRGESIGVVSSPVMVPVNLVNTDSEKTVTIMWDGHPYVFPPQTPVEVDSTLVPALVTQARVPTDDFPRGAKLEVFTPPASAPEPTPESLPKAPKPRKTLRTRNAKA